MLEMHCAAHTSYLMFSFVSFPFSSRWVRYAQTAVAAIGPNTTVHVTSGMPLAVGHQRWRSCVSRLRFGSHRCIKSSLKYHMNWLEWWIAQLQIALWCKYCFSRRKSNGPNIVLMGKRDADDRMSTLVPWRDTRVSSFSRSRLALAYSSLMVKIVHTFNEWLARNFRYRERALHPSRSIPILDSSAFYGHTRLYQKIRKSLDDHQSGYSKRNCQPPVRRDETRQNKAKIKTGRDETSRRYMLHRIAQRANRSTILYYHLVVNKQSKKPPRLYGDSFPPLCPYPSIGIRVGAVHLYWWGLG